MSALPKIVAGVLATTAVTWFLNGPLAFGENCAAAARVEALARPSMPATSAQPASAAADCQTSVDQAARAGTIGFQSGGSAVSPQSGALLDGIATALRNCPILGIEVSGHTDSQGDAVANQALSQRRAEAVLEELAKRGVPRGRLTARGYGETRLLFTNGPENDPRNRRIEFRLTAPRAVPAA